MIMFMSGNFITDDQFVNLVSSLETPLVRKMVFKYASILLESPSDILCGSFESTLGSCSECGLASVGRRCPECHNIILEAIEADIQEVVGCPE